MRGGLWEVLIEDCVRGNLGSLRNCIAAGAQIKRPIFPRFRITHA